MNWTDALGLASGGVIAIFLRSLIANWWSSRGRRSGK